MALRKACLLGLLLLGSTLSLVGCGGTESSASSSLTSLPEITAIDETEIVSTTSAPSGVTSRPLVSEDFKPVVTPTLAFGINVFLFFPKLTRAQIPVTTIDLIVADKKKAFLFEGIQNAYWESSTDEGGNVTWSMDVTFYPGVSNFFSMGY